MDDEIEDLVGDVKYTDSQKSVATSNVYSLDFTDSSSDKNNSSGKDTYVIERDDSDDSEKTFHLQGKQSVINLKDTKHKPPNMNIQYEAKISKATSACFQTCSVAQEIFTQTSKTIIELAETENSSRKTRDNKTLETQTSFISISENKTVEYRIQVSATHAEFKNCVDNHINNASNFCSITCNEILNNSLDDGSSKFPISESENDRTDDTKSNHSSSSNNGKIIKILSDDELKNIKNESQYEDSSVFEKSDTDIDEDSLMCNEYTESNKNYKGDNTSDTSEVPKSIDSEVEDLYKKLSEKTSMNVERSCEQDMPRFHTLSPLTEESERVATKKESILDITPDCGNISGLKDDDKYLVFTNSTAVKVKAMPTDDIKNDRENVKLPAIKSNQSCPTSPHLNFLFSSNTQRNHKPYSSDGPRKWDVGDRWEIGTKDLAAGESLVISGRSDPFKKPETLQLPPIHAEGHPKQILPQKTTANVVANIQRPKKMITPVAKPHDSINITDKITELKLSNNSLKHLPQEKFNVLTSEGKKSRSASPGSGSPDESRLGDVAERGCDTLCVELLRRLRSASWFEIADTLEEIPRVMEKFWAVIPEHRIADLIRQVCAHVESPRTQVALSACHTLSTILKNTNYTKKPDFYEAVTSLLVKTGSFSRPVRRAANVALDGVVCGVELTHAVTALCVHGVGHKSPLVRCAAARLLVVCCALAGGGRELLRTRPPSAVCARRHALRALAALLEDKSTDTRKYAERLYSMLRPLANFEAFYLTDVEVDVAARQMKRFDQTLLCGPPKEAR